MSRDDDVKMEGELQRESTMRTFDTGATRSAEGDKLDYEGFLCPWVLERYAQYLHEHRTQADGQHREADNWQKGIPKREYIKSLIRHTIDFWKAWRRGDTLPKQMQDLVCAILFNGMGWLHEDLREGRNARASMKDPDPRAPFARAGSAASRLDPEEIGYYGSVR